MSTPDILLVEDNELNRRLLVRQLTRLGIHGPALACNGAEALTWLDGHDCRLILADCQMPGMDGYEMTRRIRSRERGTGKRLPIVALSAGATERDSINCLAAGMDAHITKPVQLDALRTILRTWLGDAESST